MSKKAMVWVIAVPLAAMVACAFLLTAVFGPSDDGLRCARTPDKAECEIRQTRFFGLIGNSSFAIQESAIRGAKGVCPTKKIGGRGSPSCNVYMILDSGQDYLVLSYNFRSQADASSEKLNQYLKSPSAPAIEIKENLLTPVLVSGGAPALFVVVTLGLRKWRFRNKAPSA